MRFVHTSVLTSNAAYCSRSCANRHNNAISPKVKRTQRCKNCDVLIKRPWVYCSECREVGKHSSRPRMSVPPRPCETCQKPIDRKDKRNRFCSRECYHQRPVTYSDVQKLRSQQRYEGYIARWLAGDETDHYNGLRDEETLHLFIRRYLLLKHESHVDHIDGNYKKNNAPENLQLLCPNCHSLTSTYGNANRGKGRPNRYVKITLG